MAKRKLNQYEDEFLHRMDAFNQSIELVQRQKAEIDRLTFLCHRSLFILAMEGYHKSDLYLLRNDFLRWLEERAAFYEGQNILHLQIAYDALQSKNNIQAIQLGTEIQELTINDLNQYLEDNYYKRNI